MYEINVLSMDDGHDGNLTLLGDGLKLPADYETISQMMAAAKMTEVVIPFTACDYKFRMETMNHVITGSQRLDELNFLAQRLSDLSQLERWKLAGAVQITGCKTPSECVNLTYNLDACAILPHIADEENLGRRHAARLISHFESIPPEILQHLDFKKLGRLVAESESGVFAGGHYIKISGSIPKNWYDCTHIPDSRKNDTCFMKIRLASASEPDGTWLKFPQEGFCEDPGNYLKDMETLAALEKLHVTDLSKCSITRCVCVVPTLEGCVETHCDLPVEDFIWKANNAAAGIEETSQGGENMLRKCYAALEFEKCSELDLAADISQNLSCYDFIPVPYADPQTYGQLMLAKKYGVADEMLLRCFDLKAIGEKAMEETSAVHTKEGIITRNNQPFQYEYFTPTYPGMQLQ